VIWAPCLAQTVILFLFDPFSVFCYLLLLFRFELELIFFSPWL